MSNHPGLLDHPKSFELFHRMCTYTDDTVCTAAVADIPPSAFVSFHKPNSLYRPSSGRLGGSGSFGTLNPFSNESAGGSGSFSSASMSRIRVPPLN